LHQITKSMNLAIIGDIHLGFRNNHQEYLRFQSDWFKNELMSLDGIQHYFFLGDIFDSRTSLSPLIINTARELFGQLSKKSPDISIHIILGNHDLFYRNHKNVHSLGILEDLGDNIKVYDKASEITIDDKKILLLPWITKDDKDDVHVMLAKNKYNICMGHLEINGFEKSRGCIEHEGMSNSIFANCEHVFSGHFHLRKPIGNINYVGTPYELDWGDYNNIKGIEVLDLATMETTFVPSKNTPKHIKISTKDVSLKDINKKMIYDNFIRLTFKEKTSEVDQIKYIEKINALNPIFFTFDNEDTISFDDNGTVINTSIKDTFEFFNEYLNVIELPDNIEKDKLIETIKELHKKCV
jgi:hypothetical protein